MQTKYSADRLQVVVTLNKGHKIKAHRLGMTTGFIIAKLKCLYSLWSSVVLVENIESYKE